MPQRVVPRWRDTGANPESLIGCALRLLRETDGDSFAARDLLAFRLSASAVPGPLPHVVAEAVICLVELEPHSEHERSTLNIPALVDGLDLDVIAESDARLVDRLKPASEPIGPGDHMAR